MFYLLNSSEISFCICGARLNTFKNIVTLKLANGANSLMIQKCGVYVNQTVTIRRCQLKISNHAWDENFGFELYDIEFFLFLRILCADMCSLITIERRIICYAFVVPDTLYLP